MNIPDAGVLTGSFMDFMSESDFAKRALYYTPRFGRFICDRRYSIDREYLDLFLLFYVCEGSLRIETHDTVWTVEGNHVALLDCRYPHRYSCPDYADFFWIHFNGCSSAEYGKLLYDQFGVQFSGNHILSQRERFERIIECARSPFPDEHFISASIHQILSHLAAGDVQAVSAGGILRPAIDYISKHYDSTIDLDLLASLCSLSTSHLIRCFKRFANCTPHEYLLAYRLRQSKQLLLTTGLSIDQISEKCGFNSSSHFARAFRRENSISPSEFRTIRF